jgi:FAD/FMN-containing dehydrogenase
LQAADLFSPVNQTHVQTASCDFFCAPIQAVRPTADSCHVWCDYFLAAAALPAFLTFLEAGLRDGTLAAGLERLHFLCIRPPQTPGQRALAALPAHSSRRFYGVGVFYSMSTTEQATLHAARAAQRALLTECLRLDGRPYLCGAHNLDEAVLRAIFGAEYATLETLRARLDPGQLFNRRSRTEAQALATP